MSQNADTESKVAETFLKPAVVGASCALLTRTMFGSQTANANNGLPSVKFWLLNGGLAFGGSMLADIAHQYVFPELPVNNKMAFTVSSLVAPAITGAAVAAGGFIYNSELVAQAGGSMFMYGAGSELAGNYLFEAVVAPYLNREDV